MRGDPADAADHVDGVITTVDAVKAKHPQVTVEAAGTGTTDKAIGEVVTRELRTAELISLPITLVILFLAFGALVAALVPLFLGLTSVIAAMGGMAVLSQITPMDEATSSLVVLLGLAVGVDYSLFYIRREREERRAGRDEHAALNATAATVGRAIVVSGVTVIAGLAGLLLTGITLFASMALATMLVVAIAVVGSLTVLPAILALLGDRINKGRLPFMPRTGGNSRVWTALANSSRAAPRTSLGDRGPRAARPRLAGPGPEDQRHDPEPAVRRARDGRRARHRADLPGRARVREPRHHQAGARRRARRGHASATRPRSRAATAPP